MDLEFQLAVWKELTSATEKREKAMLDAEKAFSTTVLARIKQLMASRNMSGVQDGEAVLPNVQG